MPRWHPAKEFWYPGPIEGVTIAGAGNELISRDRDAAMVPKRDRAIAPGVEIRVQIGQVDRALFVCRNGRSFWESVQGSEYGFWAGVSRITHPRWSQATERVLGITSAGRLSSGTAASSSPTSTTGSRERLFA